MSKTKLDEKLTLTLVELSNLKTQLKNSNFLDLLDNLSPKQILYHLSKGNLSYSAEQNKQILDVLEKKEYLGNPIAIQVLDQKLNLTPNDYNRIFDQRANPNKQDLASVSSNYGKLYAGLLNDEYSTKAFNACKDHVKKLYKNLPEDFVVVLDAALKTNPRTTSKEVTQKFDQIVNNFEELGKQQQNLNQPSIDFNKYVSEISKFASTDLNKRLMNEGKIKMNYQNANYEIVQKHILEGKINVLNAFYEALNAGNDSLADKILEDKSLPIEQKLTLFDKLSHPRFTLSQLHYDSNNLIEDPKQINTIPYLTKLAQNIEFDQNNLPKNIDKLLKNVHFLNENIHKDYNKNSKDKVAQQMIDLTDTIAEKYITASPKIDSNIINYAINDRKDPNLKLLDIAFAKGKALLPDEKIMQQLSKRNMLAKYLDEYLEKILLTTDDKEIKAAILDQKFNHEFMGGISVKQYQETRKEFVQNIEEVNVEGLKNFINGGGDKGLRMLHTLFNLKNNPEAVIAVASNTLNEVSSDLEYQKKIVKSLELVAQNMPHGEQILAESLYNAKIDYVHKPILKYHEAYNKAINSENPQDKISAIDHYLKNDQEKDRHLVVEIIRLEQNLEKQKPLIVESFKNVCKNGKNTEIINELKSFLGDNKMRNAEIILEATRGINLKDKDYSSLNATLDKIYDEKVRGHNKGDHLHKFDKLMKSMSPKDFGKLMLEEKITKSSSKKLPEGLNHESLSQFKQATKALKGNLEGNNVTAELSSSQKQEASKNLLQNLSREQMTYVVESVKAYENFSQKNWLSKALSNFADGIKKAFSKRIDNAVIQEGVRQVFEEGAKLRSNQQVANAKTISRH